jgi:hypothetical protein
MEPLPQPCGPLTDDLMDFIVGLLDSSRKCHAKQLNAILVVVNQYTQQAHYFLSHNLFNVIGPAEILAQKLSLQGSSIPQSIMSKCEPQFTLKFWAAFC